MAKSLVQWSAMLGTRGCMRTWYVSGAECKMRQGRVMRPEGTRGTLLTDWRPDRMHRPHSPQSGEPLFIHPSLHSAFAASLSASYVRLPRPSTLQATSPLDLLPSPRRGLSLSHQNPTCLHSSPRPTPAPILLPQPPSPPPVTTLRDSTFPDVRWLLHHWDRLLPLGIWKLRVHGTQSPHIRR